MNMLDLSSVRRRFDRGKEGGTRPDTSQEKHVNILSSAGEYALRQHESSADTDPSGHE